MSSHAVKSQENKAPQDVVTQQKRDDAFSFADQRPATIQFKHLQRLADNSPQVRQLKSLQTMTTDSARQQETLQLQTIIQRKTNGTGLPDNLKSGIEDLSGLSMDDVKVHYNSDKPANLQAHAYAQGTDIHVAPGQEEHLPHEAWHVVQQKQGRVRPTMQLKKGIAVNDDDGLEKEADVMGAKAIQLKLVATNARLAENTPVTDIIVQRVLSESQILTIKAQIAAQQQIVNANRAVITNGSRTIQGQTELRPGLTRNRLGGLMISLTASIAARQHVVDYHAELGEADPGNHQERIEIEEYLLQEAGADHASIARIPASAWQRYPVNHADYNNYERRRAARWDRDPITWERRPYAPPGVDNQGFQPVVRRR